jgi:cell division protease FtsH
MNTRLLRSAAVPLLVISLIAFVVLEGSNRSKDKSQHSYKQLYQQIDDKKVDAITVQPEKNKLIVKLKKTKGSSDQKTYELGYATEADIDNLNKHLPGGRENKIYDPKPIQGTSVLSYLLQYVLPFGLIIVFWFFIMNQMQGGGNRVMSFGKSRAKRLAVDAPKVTFRDVAGVDEAVEELQEIKEFLENPKKFQALGARIPKGVLLFGPPGTGKTLLARAVAGEAGVPFFSISGSDFVEMFVGVGASRVRDLFEQAKLHAPCIIFVDEIDAVGRHRGAGLGGGNDEREQTLNQLLVEMDGFEMKDNIIIVAATNRPDILDPALLRPGRFDRQIRVDVPDRPGREQILKVHTKGKPLEKGVNVPKLAGQTPGFTGADLANLVNEAALIAARRGLKRVGMPEMEEGIMRVIVGPEKKGRLMSEREKHVTAVHEMGHALCAHYLEHADPVHKISVVGRGMALGYVVSMPTEDRFTRRKVELMAQLAQALGGRTAEEIVFDEFTTGAENDLKKVTETAKRMVMRWGMSEKLGPRAFGGDSDHPFLGRDFQHEPDYSDDLAREIDAEIHSIIEEAHSSARQLLTDHRDQLEAMANILVEHETIDSEQFLRLIEGDDPTDIFGGGDDTPTEPEPDASAEGDKSRQSPTFRPRPGFGTSGVDSYSQLPPDSDL